MRKGSYFYVIDAFIAAIIIVSAVIILFSRFLAQPSPTQAYYTGEELLATLESTKMQTYAHPTTRAWVNNGTVDGQRSVLEQIALFNITGKLNESKLLAEIVGNTTPRHVGIEILANGQQLHIYEPMPQQEADSRLVAQRILLLRKSPTDAYPPVIMEVRTWQ